MKMKIRLARLSICSCGFTLLDDSIKLGQEYETDPMVWQQGSLICGGCKRELATTSIYVLRRGAHHAGYIPVSVFKVDPDHPKAATFEKYQQLFAQKDAERQIQLDLKQYKADAKSKAAQKRKRSRAKA